MSDAKLPTAITEAISAIRCDARFGDTIRSLESTLTPWLAIVREVAERDPWREVEPVRVDGIAYRRERWCMYCDGTTHAPTCLWLRATQLVTGRGTW